MTNEIIYENSTVKIKNKDDWEYQGVNVEKIKFLNPTLSEKIQQEVNNYLDNKEKIDAEIQAEKDRKLIEERTKQVEEFKNLINNDYSSLLKGFKVEFAIPNSNNYYFNPKKFSFGGVEIHYSDSVSSNNGWGGGSKTTRIWVMTFDYKDRRYVSLEKAIKSGVKLVEEVRINRAEKVKIENERMNKEKILEKFAKDNGFEFKTDYHRSKYSSEGYYSYSMSNDKLVASIYYDSEKGEVIIRSYTVNKKDKITVEELKKVI